ncbi:AbrB/MazE/SpoVT family DNA-binding domain-containing protein [Gemmatimonas sp.]|uniref:AbrB/MazE/SpoVT family DNA-binding domain-containing protein n=1 Tax=Gemmatimonas sp. TaxID=1962908 RepID=UPI00356A0416
MHRRTTGPIHLRDVPLGVIAQQSAQNSALLSSKGQIVIPAELRQQDGIEAGQEFDIERLKSRERLLRRRSMTVDDGALKWLLDCPATDWFVPIKSESTDTL